MIGFLVESVLLLLDYLVPHIHVNANQEEGIIKSRTSKIHKMMFAVIIHNIPGPGQSLI